MVVVVDVVPPGFLLRLDFLDTLLCEPEFLGQTVDDGLVAVFHTQFLGHLAAYGTSTDPTSRLMVITNFSFLFIFCLYLFFIYE